MFISRSLEVRGGLRKCDWFEEEATRGSRRIEEIIPSGFENKATEGYENEVSTGWRRCEEFSPRR